MATQKVDVKMREKKEEKREYESMAIKGKEITKIMRRD